MHAANMEEFVAGVVDGEVVVHILLEVQDIVEQANPVLDEVGVEWIMKVAVVMPG